MPDASGRAERTDLDDTVLWLGGSCGAAGAAGGFFVGYVYGRDQATVMSNAPGTGS